MATTSLWKVSGSLKKVLDYAENPDKTSLKNVIDYASDGSKTDDELFKKAKTISQLKVLADREYKKVRK